MMHALTLFSIFAGAASLASASSVPKKVAQEVAFVLVGDSTTANTTNVNCELEQKSPKCNCG